MSPIPHYNDPQQQPAAAPAGAAAGWYPDPYGAPRLLRFWDGQRWTETTKGMRYDGDAYAWALALGPLLLIGTFFAAYLSRMITDDATRLAGLATAGFTVVIGLLDVGMLGRRPGVRPPNGALLLVAPLYLIVRTQRIGSTPLMPILWLGAALVSVVGVSAAPYQAVASPYVVEMDIQSGIQEQADVRRVDVECGEFDVVREGETVDCIARMRGTQTLVEVEFDGAGGYSWRVP